MLRHVVDISEQHHFGVAGQHILWRHCLLKVCAVCYSADMASYFSAFDRVIRKRLLSALLGIPSCKIDGVYYQILS